MGAVVRTDASPASEEPAGTPATWLFESKNAVAAHSARKQFSNFCGLWRWTARHRGGGIDLRRTGQQRGAPRARPDCRGTGLDERRKRAASINDTGPVFQYTPSLPDDALCESGRGLYIVACLSKELHIVQGRKGAVVVAVLPVYSA